MSIRWHLMILCGVVAGTVALAGFAQDVPRPGQAGSNLDSMLPMERQDFGVAPTQQLPAGAMHAPTPSSIPGGQVITTKGLVALVRGRYNAALRAIHVGYTNVLWYRGGIDHLADKCAPRAYWDRDVFGVDDAMA